MLTDLYHIRLWEEEQPNGTLRVYMEYYAMGEEEREDYMKEAYRRKGLK